MRVLIACEKSGVIREAFRARGYDAWSCDLELPDDHSMYHLWGDVRSFLSQKWDLVIAHPPCCHLAISGAGKFAEKNARGLDQLHAIDFFMEMIRIDAPFLCVENPVSIMSSIYRKPTQIIHPYHFGDPEFKKTCLWLKGLPPLKHVNPLIPPVKGTPEHRAWQKVLYMSESPERKAARSKTYSGIANAMADQWGEYVKLTLAA